MVEPQEDLILKMISNIQTSQSDMKQLTEQESPYLSDRASNNVLRVETFQKEVNIECADIQNRINSIRHKI